MKKCTKLAWTSGVNPFSGGFPKGFILLFLLFFLGGPVWGQRASSHKVKAIPLRIAELENAGANFAVINPFTEVVAPDDLRTEEQIQREAIGLTPNFAEMNSIQRSKPEYLEIVMPSIKAESLRLRLFRVSLGNSKTQIRSASGRIIEDCEGVFYRGVIQGDSQSLVAISIFPDHIRGFISNHAENFILGPMQAGPHILYNEKVLPQRNIPVCSMNDPEVIEPAGSHVSERSQPSGLSCIGVYWEVDNNIFTSNGNMNATVNWMNGLANEVYTLYQNEDVMMATSVMNIWDTPSPYTGTDVFARLTSFQSLNGVLDGDLAQYVHLSNFGGIAAGLNGLCNSNYDQSMCYSGLLTTYSSVPVYSWNVAVCTHEMGHLLGSRHTHACVWNGNNTRIDNCSANAGVLPEDNCSSNPPDPAEGGTIMSYCHLRPVGMNFALGFGPQPGEVIRNSVSNAAGCLGGSCECPIGPSSITFNTVYTNDLVVPGDLVIESGASLTISGATLYFKEGKRLIVKRNARLVIRDGGKVKRGCDAPHWKGIEVEGNSQIAQSTISSVNSLPPLNTPAQSGYVIPTGGGQIEWAQTGVSLGRNYDPAFWGGLVYSDGGKFRNNFRDLDFMPYAFPNGSRFINTDFWSNIDDVGITEGVWIWGTNGIEFSGCTFSAYDFEAIRVFDARIRVTDRNIFWRNERGVSIEATYPSFASAVIGGAQFQENIFWDNKYHIVGQAVGGVGGSVGQWPFPLDVVNNEFIGGELGVVVSGPSFYRIGGNHFSGPMTAGNLMLHTGYNSMFFSMSACNRFENSGTLGALAAGDNHRLNFWQNKFSLPGAGSTDLGVNAITIPGWFSIPGSIHVSQGRPQFPADNCFTNPGIKTDIATSGNTQPFLYYYRGGEHTNCKHEPLNPGSYSKFSTPSQSQAFGCGDFGGAPLLPPNPTGAGLQAIRQLLASYGSSAPSQPDSVVLYSQLQQEKAALLWHLVQAALDSADYQHAESLLAGEQNRAADWAIFGLRTSRRDYAGALSWLQQIPATDVFDLEFRNMQLINLAFLQNPATYALSVADSSYLHGIAMGLSPVRDYARSLLGLLTGQRFDIWIPGMEAQQQPPAVESRASAFDWRVFPNPANETLQLAWPAVTTEDWWNIAITDLAGRVLRNERMAPSAGAHTLQTGSLQNGFYILSISDRQQTIQHRAKFVVRR